MEKVREVMAVACRKCGDFEVESELSHKLFPAIGKLEHFPVVLFVGSDKVTGDSLAPICGTLLKEMGAPCFCYGDLLSPVNAKNLTATVEFIKAVHAKRKLLIVDASVGLEKEIGKVRFLENGIAPGNAVGRNFEEMGDFSIVGVVAKREEKTSQILPVRLANVCKMAGEIARELYFGARSFAEAKGGKM